MISKEICSQLFKTFFVQFLADCLANPKQLELRYLRNKDIVKIFKKSKFMQKIAYLHTREPVLDSAINRVRKELQCIFIITSFVIGWLLMM